MTVVVCGAAAGILSGDLGGDRQTLDCDVIVSEPSNRFAAVAAAAAAVAEELDLKRQWLNQEAKMFAHLLPVGWRDRLSRLDKFGPLDVLIISRQDPMALKLVGSDRRPHDLEDIEQMQPTAAELDFLSQHLDRLEAESLEREAYDDERGVIEQMRKQL